MGNRVALLFLSGCDDQCVPGVRGRLPLASVAGLVPGGIEFCEHDTFLIFSCYGQRPEDHAVRARPMIYRHGAGTNVGISVGVGECPARRSPVALILKSDSSAPLR